MSSQFLLLVLNMLSPLLMSAVCISPTWCLSVTKNNCRRCWGFCLGCLSSKKRVPFVAANMPVCLSAAPALFCSCLLGKVTAEKKGEPCNLWIFCCLASRVNQTVPGNTSEGVIRSAQQLSNSVLVLLWISQGQKDLRLRQKLEVFACLSN